MFVLKVDFGQASTVKTVVTKGLGNSNEFVKQYMLMYSNADLKWITVYNGANNVSQQMPISKLRENLSICYKQKQRRI